METKNYKWTLRRGSQKEFCPCCGQKRFVPYVSTADGVTPADVTKYGRCDRETNCGYHAYPSSDVATPENAKPIERPPFRPIRFDKVAVTTDVRTPLFSWVAGLIGIEKAMDVWTRYKIGKDGKRTIFWQIAADGTIRAGKSIPYLDNGHRDKEDKMPASWLHKNKAYKYVITGKDLEQCFFGEHLLNEQQTVVIVESEKTAAVMSAITTGWVWLASGGSCGLQNPDKNRVLKGREVWLLPDNGQYWKWKTIADANGWNIFDICEKYPIFEGCDILDYIEAGTFNEIIKELKENETKNK